MLDYEGDLPYVVWWQCKSCTHLFYNQESKILSHLREKHGFINGQNPPASSTSSRVFINSSTPVRIKEEHLRAAAVSSTSSGTDGDAEDTLSSAEIDMQNNNNNDEYAKNLALPRRKARFFLKNNVQVQQVNHNQSISNNNNRIREETMKIIPSIEDLKKQLMKSDIDISEIKMSNQEDDEVCDEEEEEGEEVLDENFENEGEEEMPQEGYGFHSESYEDQDDEEISEDQDPEEGASTSNQSFYDNDIGGHFLFKNENDSESNYEEEGTMTPNFSMMEELYRRADIANNATVATTSTRKRTFFNPCKLCKRNFPSLSMLKKHAKTHLNEDGGSQHVCKFCFEYFASAAGLSKHLRVHSQENPNVCNICSKSFTSWATLRTHLKIHSGDRPFGCDVCGQRFQTKSTLDSHLRIHTGSRPHICPICSKSFRTSSPLYRHMRSVHRTLNAGKKGSVLAAS